MKNVTILKFEDSYYGVSSPGLQNWQEFYKVRINEFKGNSSIYLLKSK